MVIYRKYRPHSFAEVVGQDTNVSILRTAIQSKSLPHALLLVGSRGTGKTTTARLIAKALNCAKFADGNDVCNTCENCLNFDAGKALNVIEIDAASNRGIEDIRNLKEGINFAPASGEKKVYIIDEVHMLTKEAFNALLKTLEEPPAHAVFILATTEPHKLPITVLSRVQRYNFKLATEEAMAKRLTNILSQERVKFDADSISLIYNYSGGSYRDAESLLTKVLASPGIEDEITPSKIKLALGLSISETVDRMASNLILEQGTSDSDVEELRSQGYDFAGFISELLENLKTQYRSNQDTKVLNALKTCLKVINEFGTDMDLIIGVAILFGGKAESSGSRVQDLSVKPQGPKSKVENLTTNKSESVNSPVSKSPISIKDKIAMLRTANVPTPKEDISDSSQVDTKPQSTDNSDLVSNLLLS